MQSVTIRDLDKHFADLLKKIPEERRAMFEELAQELLTDVRGRIGGAGKVQSWQESYVGSGGGYAKVWPKKDVYTESGGKLYAVGYVTNAITSGHRTPRGGYVPGKHFYADTHAMVPVLIDRVKAKFEARIEEAL